ncbi:MAG: Asp-tRNA(Asn)/Glu-tRNA(Gln) amidotransferase subunit GatC [Planctomycetota bacterium]
MIDKERVRNVSQLARLGLGDEELEAYVEELGRILEYFQEVDKIDTEGVEPGDHPNPPPGPLRIDLQQPSIPREIIMGNTLYSVEGFYQVPRVIE